MKYQIITLFPDLFAPFRSHTLLSKAHNEGRIQIETSNLRDYAINTQGQVDDAPYGGGGGMICRIESAVAAVESAKKKDPSAKVILLTPRGVPFTQKAAKSLVEEAQDSEGGFILFCSRYEGVDERFVEGWVDYEFSFADAIYMGGEVPAMAFMEATARLLPGVLGNEASLTEESFESGGLEYPQYTRPSEFRGRAVPEVLLRGNHRAIAEWRQKQSLLDTSVRRPDLLNNIVPEQGSDGISRPPMYLALMHYPVVDKQGETITSSVTNLDVHDIARSVRTFELDGYYVVHPSLTLRKLIQKVCDHWAGEAGLSYNPNRSEALQYIKTLPVLDDVLTDINQKHGVLPRIVVTSARPGERMTTYDDFRKLLPHVEEPLLILFGTAWGLHQDIIDRAEYRLAPIYGPGEYNHLSVRSAVAIILDRLFGS
jgi:tRNA (guanine37-N1)-methyltransferase